MAQSTNTQSTHTEFKNGKCEPNFGKGLSDVGGTRTPAPSYNGTTVKFRKEFFTEPRLAALSPYISVGRTELDEGLVSFD